VNGAELLLTSLAAAGVEVCFANFGTTEVALVAALDSVPAIRAVPALFEGVCTGAADGYGRMRDKPAMTLLHLGLGLANGLSNLHNAKRAGTPVLNVVGQHATWHLPWDSLEKIDIQGLADPVAGWVKTCSSVDTMPQDAVDAVRAASRGQVAVLMVPQDCQWTECLDKPVEEVHFSPDRLDEAPVKEAARLLGKGRTALLYLGGRTLRRRGLLAAARIQAATGCEVLSETFVSRIERGAGLPLVGRLPYFPEQAVECLSRYEAVVLAGAAEPVATFAYRGGQSRLLTENHSVSSVAEGNQDVEEVLEFLADLVDRSGKAAPVTGLHQPLDRPRVAQGLLTVEAAGTTLAALQPESVIMVDEAVTSGSPYYHFSAGAPPHTVLGLTGGAIGQGMPCAVGAAIACPDRPVINLQADGSAMYTLQALWTQARERLNVTTLVCANRGYDILKVEMVRAGYVPMGRSALALTDLGSPPLDWVQLSQGMGVPAASVATAEDLARELGQALKESGPHLIEMVLGR
jgi:acetolactate synthase I/II/III large subunit